MARRLGDRSSGRGGWLPGVLVRPRRPAAAGQGLPLGGAARALDAPGLVRGQGLAPPGGPGGAGRRPDGPGQPVPARRTTEVASSPLGGRGPPPTLICRQILVLPE